MSEHFGDLTIQWGDDLEFLGMNIHIDRKNKHIKITMKKHLFEAIEMFGEDLRSGVTSPAYKDIFTTYDDISDQLGSKQSEIFHSVTAKLLYITKRARPDLETAISYLTTRVSKSNNRDWYKLKRVLSFIKETIDDPRIMGAASLHDLITWIDASYAVHPNMRGHTGGVMSYGKGVVHARAGKQKLNVKSSTECEIVGVSEYMPFNIWQMLFMEAQGYPLHQNVLFQDNQSAIRMEKTGAIHAQGIPDM